MPEEAKRKLSQEEKRFANLAKRFIRQASIATKNFRMFGEKHPVLINSIRNIRELLKSALAGRNSITYTFLEGTFLVEDIPLKDLDLKVYSIIPELKQCGITSLTFMPETTEEEIKLLLKTISSGPASLKAEGGIINLFQKKNITNIRVDETYFKKVSKKEEEAEKAKSHLADMLVAEYLLGKKSISKGDIGALVGEISGDPKRIGKILSRTASSKEHYLPGGYISDPDNGSATFARTSIEKLAVHMKKTGDKSGADVKRGIGNLILALEPSIRVKILRTMAKPSEEPSHAIADAASAFSDEVIVNVIATDFIESKSPVVQMRKLIRRLLPDTAKRARILPLLEKKLLQKGVSQGVCSELLEGKFWADMTNEEKVKSIEKHDPLYSMEIGVAVEITNLISSLLAEKKFDSIRIVVDKLLGNLSSGDMGLKIRFVRDFEHVAVLLFQSGYPHNDKLLDRIGKGYKETKEKAIEARFTKLITSLAGVCVKDKRYSNLPALIAVAGYESVKNEIFKESTLDELLKNLISDKKMDKNLIQRLSQLIGKDAEHALCEILTSIEEDDFDAYKRRHEIAGILKGFGEGPEAFLIEKLSSGKIEAVKNALEALSEIGTEGSIPPVEGLAGHKDAEVQKRAKLALKKIQKRAKK